MPLVIVESPNKCAKIKKILGDNYVVKASVGHIFELDKKNNGVDLENWLPVYVDSPDKKDVIASLKDEAKKHDIIYIASDGDREGENIAYSIKDILPKKDKKIYRVIFNELTKSAIDKAIKNPIGFNEKLNSAQQTRRILDRLIGFKFSPVLWSKGLKGTSAGRVQSVVLNWIVSLEKEIKAFKKEEYWTIVAETKHDFSADFFGINGTKFVPKNKDEAYNIVNNIKDDLIVSEYNAKTRTRAPLAPYITATLQQDITSKFNWTAKKVMDVAQNLFSMGLITYIRTDSTRIEQDKLDKIRENINTKYGKDYLYPTPRIYKNADSTQDAHEAILYTGEAIPSSISSDESKLLEAINNRAIASQMTDAIFDSTSITLESQCKNKYQFKATGSILNFDGFTKVYQINSKDVMLPKLTIGQLIKIQKLIPEQHFTKPPSRFTETSIVTEMKKTEVGRPSTYVSSIEVLFKHGYIIREQKSFKPTEIGILVSDYLEKYYNDIVDTNFTADMEKKLDQVEVGKIITKDIMVPFYDNLLKKIDVAKKENPRDLFKVEVTCPDCKNAKMVRNISNGKVFLSCENYPTCGHTMNYQEDGTLVSSKQETGIACPECNGKILERTGKFGKFFSCENYKTCTWKGKVEDGKIVAKKIQEVTDIDCPLCQKKMIKRTAGTNTFLGCSGWPSCKSTLNIDASGNVVAKTKIAKKAPKLTKEKCPKCNVGKIVIREKDGSEFKACDKWPKCKYTGKMK